MSRLAAVLVLLAAALSGCSTRSGGNAATTPADHSVPTGSQAPATAAVDVPLQTAGYPMPVVTVVIGGGHTVKVALDTGSSGLYIQASAMGASVTRSGLPPVTQRYVGQSVTAQVVLASVQIRTTNGQDVQTSPMEIGSFADANALPGITRLGLAGIMGVAPGSDAPSRPPLLSPLAQLPRPFANGYTVDLPAAALTLGVPTGSATSVSIPLTRADWSFPGGLPGYERDMTLCWTVGQHHTCAPTTLDTGGRDGIVSSTLLPAVPTTGGKVENGQPISISAPNGMALFGETASAQHAPRYTPFGVMNTGEQFFLANAVTFNLSTGRTTISPSDRRVDGG